MIPGGLVKVKKRLPDGTRTIMFPLLPLWLAVTPILLFAAPLACLAGLFVGINPRPAIAAGLRLLVSMRGTHIEFDTGSESVLVEI